MRHLVVLAVLLTSAIPSAAGKGETQRFVSAGERVALLELFTSEGCSSCPPADRWLSGLRSHNGLWQEFVPIALHVDYWDYIGWTDEFASPDFSQRQRRYAAEGATRTVYTPGLFLDGREWRGWFRGESPSNTATGTAGALSIDVTDQQAEIAYLPPGQLSDDLVVHVAILGMGVQTEVLAGENRGRRLEHDFIVLDLAQRPLRRNGKIWSASLELAEPEAATEGLAIAAWVSRGDRQAPLQAVGGYLQ